MFLEMAPHLRQHLGVALKGCCEEITVVAVEQDFAQPAPVAPIVRRYVIPFIVSVIGIRAAVAPEHQAARTRHGADFAKLFAQLFELLRILAEQLRQVHALALGTAGTLRGFELCARFEQLADLLRRQRASALATRLRSGGIHRDLIVGLPVLTVAITLAVTEAVGGLSGTAHLAE